MNAAQKYFCKPSLKANYSHKPSSFANLGSNDSPSQRLQSSCSIRLPATTRNKYLIGKPKSGDGTPLSKASSKSMISRSGQGDYIDSAIVMLKNVRGRKQCSRMWRIEDLIQEMEKLTLSNSMTSTSDEDETIRILKMQITEEIEQKQKAQLQTEQMIRRQKQTITLLQQQCEYFSK